MEPQEPLETHASLPHSEEEQQEVGKVKMSPLEKLRLTLFWLLATLSFLTYQGTWDVSESQQMKLMGTAWLITIVMGFFACMDYSGRLQSKGDTTESAIVFYIFLVLALLATPLVVFMALINLIS